MDCDWYCLSNLTIWGFGFLLTMSAVVVLSIFANICCTPLFSMMFRGLVIMFHDRQSKRMAMLGSIGESAMFLYEFAGCLVYDILCALVPFGHSVTVPKEMEISFPHCSNFVPTPAQIDQMWDECVRTEDFYDCTNLGGLFRLEDCA